jgi:hypothetical protein
VIAARRVELLEKVAENCRIFGSPDVVVVQADVQKESDCKAIIDCAIKHFEIREYGHCNFEWQFSSGVLIVKPTCQLVSIGVLPPLC